MLLKHKQAKKQGRLVRTLRNLVISTLILTVIISAQLVFRKPLEVDPDPFVSAIPVITGDFKIRNPYDQPGEYYKAQLHSHTNKSLDGHWTVAEAVRAYKDKGYSYLAITDHDKVTIYKELDDSNFITISGEENTINYPFWPLGQHMARLFVDKHARWGKAQSRINSTLAVGGIAGFNHPNWVGNLETGKWKLSHMLALEGFTLVEVYNGYSDSNKDTQRWHELIRRLGPDKPVWATAVDDAHDLRFFNKGWIMVKTNGISEEALKKSLQNGSFYPTTGPQVLFDVVENKITVTVQSGNTQRIIFIGANDEVIFEANGTDYAEFDATGNEGFIRVEIINSSGKKAWSQPFWLVKRSELH